MASLDGHIPYFQSEIDTPDATRAFVIWTDPPPDIHPSVWVCDDVFKCKMSRRMCKEMSWEHHLQRWILSSTDAYQLSAEFPHPGVWACLSAKCQKVRAESHLPHLKGAPSLFMDASSITCVISPPHCAGVDTLYSEVVHEHTSLIKVSFESSGPHCSFLSLLAWDNIHVQENRLESWLVYASVNWAQFSSANSFLYFYVER